MSRLETIGEFGLIEKIKGWVPCGREVVRGIGDDCAVLAGRKGYYELFAIDTIVEDVDFTLKKAKPEQIGWKALAINLSDIAAMGGIPKAAAVSLTLPPKTSVEFVRRFYAGMGKLAKRFRVSIAGGDLSRGSKISCTVAILGEVERSRIVYRTGARIGDFICATGTLGGSILGKHLNFTPRVSEGRLIGAHGATSMIDLSDGLAQDVKHLSMVDGHVHFCHSRESGNPKTGFPIKAFGNDRVVGFEIEEELLPISSAALKLANGNRKKAVQHALSDGEDFELLFTIRPDRYRRLRRAWSRRFRTPLRVIGMVVEPSKCWVFSGARKGFHHF